jgi:hypothetical protein
MVFDDQSLVALSQAQHPETGMNLQVLLSDVGPIALSSDGAALPCYQTTQYYNLFDLIAGLAPPVRGTPNFQLPRKYTVAPNHAHAQAHIPPPAGSPTPARGSVTVPVGARPLLASRKLTAPRTFLRYISSGIDWRFQGTTLLPGTYLTTPLEARVANSGFAAVGRFSLPLPIPACTVIHYELPRDAVIEAGTVAPLFGQSGGGVEVCVLSCKSVRRIRSRPIPEY